MGVGGLVAVGSLESHNLEGTGYKHAFHKYVLYTYCVAGTVLGAGDTAVNKTDIPALMALTFWWGEKRA